MKRTAFVSIFVIVLVLVFAPWTHGQDQAAASGANAALKEFGDHFIGRWITDITWAADLPGLGKEGERLKGYEIYRWIVDGKAVEDEWYLGPIVGKILHWWDAASRQIKIMGLDSSGRTWEGVITIQGEKFIGTAEGSLEDGQRFAYKWEVSFENNGNTQISAGVLILNGVQSEFRDVYKRVGK